ncbi:hypothetical protein MTO96_037463 [Rhipicephalus appendiculatus]
MLQIQDLQMSDSGAYTCKASSESGETSWTASLTVDSPHNPNVNFHRSPDPSTFPGPPSQPVAVNTTETSITLTWARSEKAGASSLKGYTIEYYSSDLQSGWVLAAHRILAETYTIQALRPDSRYIFIIRAENAHGLGVPSPVSETIRTLGMAPQFLPEYNLDEARAKLSASVVTLQDIRAMSSTAVKLNWKVQGSKDYVEGFYVRFRDMSGGSQKYNMVTVLNGGALSYVLNDLRKFTNSPVHFKMESPTSSTSLSTPLQNIVTQSWFIALFGFLLLTAVTIFVIFLVRKRRLEHAKTIITAPVHKQEDIRNCFNSLSGPASLSPHEALWIDHSAWRASDTLKEPFCETKGVNKMSCASNDLNYSSVYAPLNCGIDATDYAEVDTYNMTTFYKKDLSSIPEPYATTTLINPSFQKSLSGSAKDNGVTDRLLESDKLASPASDSGSYTTDEYGMPVKKSRQKFSRGRVTSRAPPMNWSEIIPPPPEKPPSEVGSQLNTPASLRRTSPHDGQPKQSLQPSAAHGQLSHNLRVVQVLPRLPAPSHKGSLNQSSNSLGSSYADPYQGGHSISAQGK